MEKIGFKSCFLDIAYNMLSNPKGKWSSWDFKGYNRKDILQFLNYLINEGVLKRKSSKGNTSYSTLKNPRKLLNICIEGFSDSQRRVILFTTKRTQKEIINGLKDKGIEFYLGAFSGVRSALREVYDSNLSIIIPERKFFESNKLKELEYDIGMHKVYSRGDVEVILPRYRKFLRKYSQNDNDVLIPSDFYTYLYMANTKNPMGRPQLDNIEKILRGKNGTFLQWK